MNKRNRKYRVKPLTYGVCGRLASGCSHMVNVTRDEFRAMLRQSVGRRTELRWGRGSREYDLPFATIKHLHAGYHYVDMYCYVTR